MSVRYGDIIAERFELGRLAGIGGMGEVYRARDLTTARAVAIKVLRASADGNRESFERFLREAIVLSELEHPGIVAYIAHGETSAGEVYLAMEWLEGQDLATRLAESQLGISETIELGRRVAEAVGAAHSRGIVHRDLKPENIFLEQNRVERAKVLDFGLARIVESSRQLTRVGIAVGTPAYMAPEQAIACGGIDARADVFSLGCVLYQGLTGRVPFGGERTRSVLLKILHDEPPRIRDVRGDVPAALDDLIHRMLSKNPDARPAGGIAVASELEAIDIDGPARPASRINPAAITRAEQRLACFVVVGDRALAKEELAVAQTTQFDMRISTIRNAVRDTGADLDVVANGTVVVTMTTTGSATDLAAQGARCALAIRSNNPDASIALVIGHRQTGADSGPGQPVERAVALLAAEDAAPSDPDSGSRPVRVDEVTGNLLDARFEVTRDAHSLLLHREREIAGAPRTVLGRPTPFVGREREISTLRSLFEECSKESVARAILVSSPAGFGKSRLCFEFLRMLIESPEVPEIWRGRGYPTSAGAPLALLGTAVRGISMIADADSPEKRRQKLLTRIARHARSDDARRVADFLGEVLRLPLPADATPALRAAQREPSLMAEQMRRAWEDFLAAECAAHPVVLVLEDIQWGDLPTIRYVDGALRRLHDRSLLVLATARPNVADLFPRLWADRGLTELRLGPLTRRACERIVLAVLGEGLGKADLDHLVEKAKGNPFYLEEFIRALASSAREHLPATLIAMVQARIERLDPEERRVLRAASVFGTHVDAARASALLGDRVAVEDVAEWLRHLSEEEFLESSLETGLPDTYEFRQALVREAAYAMLTEADRRLAHRLAGEWLEREDRDPLEVAHHFECAGDPERAAVSYLKAAEAALRASDLEGAVALCKNGVERGASGELYGALRGTEAAARMLRVELELAERAAIQALESLPHGTERWCAAGMILSSATFLQNHWERAEGTIDDLLRLEPAESTRNACIAAIATIALLSSRAGRHDNARRYLARVAALVKDTLQLEPFTSGRLALAESQNAWFGEGDCWAQFRHARRSAEAFQIIDDLTDVAYARCCEGTALIAMGAYQAAEQVLGRTVEMVDAANLPLAAAVVRPWFALALAHLGDYDGARAAARRAAEVSRAARNEHIAGAASLALAVIELVAGDHAAAEQEAAKLVAAGEPYALYQVEALAPLAAARVALGKIAEALASAEVAIGWLESRGGIGHFESMARLAHAEALERSGSREMARAAISRVKKRVIERSLTIGDPDFRRRFLEVVPENVRTLALAELGGAAHG